MEDKVDFLRVQITAYFNVDDNRSLSPQTIEDAIKVAVSEMTCPPVAFAFVSDYDAAERSPTEIENEYSGRITSFQFFSKVSSEVILD